MKYITFLFTMFTLSLFAQSAKRHEVIADSLIALGKTEEAIAFLKKELKTNPDKESLYRAIGNSYFSLEKNSEGRKYYQQALKINPRCANCYANIANSFLVDSVEKAKEFIDKAIAISDTSDHYFAIRGDYFATKGHYFDALLDYKKAIELNPSAVNYYYRSRLNASNNYLSLALEDCNKAIEINPNFVAGYQLRAEINYDLKKYEIALKDLDATIFLDSTNADAYNQKGVLLDLLKRREEAISNYSKSIELDDKNYFTYYNRSMVYYKMEDMDNTCLDLKSAIRLIEKEGKENPLAKDIRLQITDICDTTKSSYYYQRGIALYNLKKYDQAIIWYKRGLYKFPSEAMTISFLGNAYLANKDYENALAIYDNAISENTFYKSIKENVRFKNAPSDSVEFMRKIFISGIYKSCAMAYLGLRKFTEAQVSIQKAFDSLPNTQKTGTEHILETYYDLRGNIYLAEQKYDLAIADFNYSIRLNSYYSFAYVNRALVKINQVQALKMTTVSLSNNYGGQSLTGAWTFPLNTNSTANNNALLTSALNDCNTAIAINKELGYAYYIRGHLKKMMMKDFCDDFIKASELGFPVEEGILKVCFR